MRLESHSFSCTDSYSTSNSKHQICYYVCCLYVDSSETINQVMFFYILIVCTLWPILRWDQHYKLFKNLVINYFFRFCSFPCMEPFVADEHQTIQRLHAPKKSRFADSIRIHKKLLDCQANVQKTLQNEKTWQNAILREQDNLFFGFSMILPVIQRDSAWLCVTSVLLKQLLTLILVCIAATFSQNKIFPISHKFLCYGAAHRV